MIKKIKGISNIGRFTQFSATGNIEFKKVSVIYAENGKGKTTLSAIFRSLKSGDSVYISERATLGTKKEPSVAIRGESENYNFKNGWDKKYPNIEVFDSTFIDKNVFSGEHVEHGHKKNLYRFVVGEKGVTYVMEVDRLDQSIRTLNGEISAKEVEIQRQIIGDTLSIEDFLELKKTKNIEELISEKESEIEVVKKARQIISRPLLQKIELPDYPLEDIKIILTKKLEDISTVAEQQTKDHIKLHLDSEGESWLRKGFSYADENCPFCGRDLDENLLIKAYRDYFNLEYKNLKTSIVSLRELFKKKFSGQTLMYIQQIYGANGAAIAFWKEYFPIQENHGVIFSEINTIWKEITEKTERHIQIKHLSPLSSISFDKDLAKSIQRYQGVKKKIVKHNEFVERVNDSIQEKRLTAGGGDLKVAITELEKLCNFDKRHQKETVILCKEYQGLLIKKQKFTKGKIDAKILLDKYADKIFEKYQGKINEYLTKFGAGFEVVAAKTGYAGGKPSSNYCIKINETSVDLGDTRVYGKPCFRNILSQGDKNSLAFAFFLSRLNQESISDKVIVFDDPINSLDEDRKTCTKQEILKIADKSDQCIIMSHDKYFLRSIWDKIPKEFVKSLQIVRSTTNGSQIKEWDIVPDTRGEYFDDFYNLLEFTGEESSTSEDLKNIARSIRPVLEGYLRIKYPKFLPVNKWLGDFIKEVKKDENTELESFRDTHLENLEDINDYSCKYHHKTNPSSNRERINGTELKTYIERAMGIINE